MVVENYGTGPSTRQDGPGPTEIITCKINHLKLIWDGDVSKVTMVLQGQQEQQSRANEIRMMKYLCMHKGE